MVVLYSIVLYLFGKYQLDNFIDTPRLVAPPLTCPIARSLSYGAGSAFQLSPTDIHLIAVSSVHYNDARAHPERTRSLPRMRHPLARTSPPWNTPLNQGFSKHQCWNFHTMQMQLERSLDTQSTSVLSPSILVTGIYPRNGVLTSS
jgi:hypothetical protein